jgi:tetratricopeptide (TPR) repeat protein
MAWFLFVVSHAVPCAAQSDDVVVAAETFRAGEAAYARGDYEPAARAFEVSNRLSPHPSALYNAGLAWEAAAKPERAADAFAAAIATHALTDAQAKDAEQRMAVLAERVGRVRIEAPTGATVSLAHADRVATPVSVHVTPGKHSAELQFADGHSETRDVEVTAGAVATLRFEAREPPPVAPPADDPPVTTTGSDGLAIAGWILAGSGLAAGAAAIGVGVAALNARDTFEASGNTDADAHDEAATLRTVTNALWFGGAALAIAGTIMLIIDATDDGATVDAAAAFYLGAETAGLELRF